MAFVELGWQSSDAPASRERICLPVSRHPEVPARSAGLEGWGRGTGAVALRGSLSLAPQGDRNETRRENGFASPKLLPDAMQRDSVAPQIRDRFTR
jgi:hypothetical protein